MYLLIICVAIAAFVLLFIIKRNAKSNKPLSEIEATPVNSISFSANTADDLKKLGREIAQLRLIGGRELDGKDEVTASKFGKFLGLNLILVSHGRREPGPWEGYISAGSTGLYGIDTATGTVHEITTVDIEEFKKRKFDSNCKEYPLGRYSPYYQIPFWDAKVVDRTLVVTVSVLLMGRFEDFETPPEMIKERLVSKVSWTPKEETVTV